MGYQRLQPNKICVIIKCLYLHTRSIAHKVAAYCGSVEAYRTAVIGITESWANKDIDDAELRLMGMICFGKTEL